MLISTPLHAGFPSGNDSPQPRSSRFLGSPRVRLRTLLVGVALIAGLLSIWRAVSFSLAYSGKVEYSQGWAKSHLLTAANYRKQASNPDCPAKDAAELRWLARKEELISQKYAALAARPWLPYPTTNAPLLTRQDWAQLGNP